MKKSKKLVLAGLVLLAAITGLLALTGCKTEVDTSSPQQEQTDDGNANSSGGGDTDNGEEKPGSGESNTDSKPCSHQPEADDGDCTTEVKCTVCGEVTTPARDSHTGGTATCVEGKVCEICGVEYDTTKNPDNHTSTEFTYTENNDGTHKKLYACCEVVHTAHEACLVGEATCTHGKLCDVCGFEYDTTKAPDNHASENYTYTDNGDGTHTKTHECGVTVGEPEDHTLTYSANGNIITESCSVGCGHSETATITAENVTYSGTEHKNATVVYSEGWIGEKSTVSYTNNTNAGTATASITIGDATATADFTIAKAPVTITLDPKTKEYGDRDPIPTYTVEGLIGDDTLGFFFSRESIEDVGVHPYKLNMSSNPGDENYTINYVGESITIVPKELNMEDLYIEMDPESFVYDGTEKKPVSLSIYDLQVAYVERKLVEGKDYEVTGYHNNVNPGTATVTIQGIGNFTGTLTIPFTITPAHQILGEQ